MKRIIFLDKASERETYYLSKPYFTICLHFQSLINNASFVQNQENKKTKTTWPLKRRMTKPHEKIQPFPRKTEKQNHQLSNESKVCHCLPPDRFAILGCRNGRISLQNGTKTGTEPK